MKVITDFFQISKKTLMILLIIGLVAVLVANVFIISDDVETYGWYEDHEHDEYCYSYEHRDDYYDDRRDGLQESKMDCVPVRYDSAFDYVMKGGYSFSYHICISLILFLGIEVSAFLILFIKKIIINKNKKEADIADGLNDILD